MAQLIAHHQHGQRRIQVRQIVDGDHQGFRHRHLPEIQRHSQHHADNAGVQQQGLQPQLAAVACDDIDAPCPAEYSKYDDVGRTIEHADAAQQRGHQGIAHKAAVGEHCGEAQAVLPFAVPVVDQQHGRRNKHHMEYGRDTRHYAEVVQCRMLQRPLKRHHHHTGGHHVHDQAAQGHRGAVIQQLDLSQYKAHHQQQVQREDLLPHGEE